MRKAFLVLIISIAVFIPRNHALGDSLNYLSPKDTIFLTMGLFNEKVFEHRLGENQTLYSLAKFYGLSIEELYYINPGLKGSEAPIGTVIRIPVPNRSIIRYKNDHFIDSLHVPVYYRVKRGDTMYKISNYYFRMELVDILERNKLDTYQVHEGQIIHIGWMSIDGIPEEYRNAGGGGPLVRRNNALKKIFMEEGTNKKEYQHQGVAFWKINSKENSDLYGLHRSAKINSIIAVTNPMKNRTVYVKVIGKTPDTAYGDDVIVVLSPLAAKLLGAKDPRFFVKIRYHK